MSRVTYVMALVVLACKDEPPPEQVADADPHALEPPADPPDWNLAPRDLRETWLGYPLAGTHTYEVQRRETREDGSLVDATTFEEQRSYSSDLGLTVSTLRIQGVRMRQPLEAWIGVSRDGWSRHWDPVLQDWRAIWPLEDLDVGDHWEAPILWYRRDNFSFASFDGFYEVVGVDVVAPDGTEGTTHISSAFDDKGYTGAWNVWYKKGPVVEQRLVVDQRGHTERMESTRIATR